MDCPGSDSQLPVPGPNQIVLKDAGPHQLFRERMLHVPVKVKGSICPPMELKRDIIFVFDISGSMGSNDPLVDGSCNRLIAINAVMDRIPSDISNFAIVTFHDSVGNASSRFYNNRDELFADIAGGNAADISKVICKATLGTNFSAGLRRAKQIFQGSGREFATKEILFVSDGDSSTGQTDAADLRNNGITVGNSTQLVTIATVMIGSVDNNNLRDRIASKDAQGAPIHALANDAASLADILTRMSHNELAGTSISFGGRPDLMRTIDLMGQLNDYKFELDPFMLDFDLVQDKYSIHLKYWDTHNNTFTIPGTILWKD